MVKYDQVVLIPGMQSWFNLGKLISAVHHVNRNIDKNFMIISKDIGKAVDTIKHHFTLTTLNKFGIQGN